MFFQLLLAVFSLLQKNMKEILQNKIFESIKIIILKGEAKILQKIEKYSSKEGEITKILQKNGLNLSQDD